ncbi:hypothetical protein MKW94_019958 [Papaver nudicaule]|uniref:Flavin-containing monooxygenase n=1 Tax=Papaver nudicaule TaxID=74823 RepID=A0AA42AQR3_PAPNU|nr:hypothetical protein [Papaver nudicaule]
MERRVIGIIGAGVSGLLACKYVLEKGFEPIVFESQPGLGGVWTHTPETTKLQSSKQAYQFSDFPWPSSVKEEYPNHNLVLKYLESYAFHLGLLPYIKFNTKVININYCSVQEGEDDFHAWSHCGGTTDGSWSNPKGKWEITTTNAAVQEHPEQGHQVHEVEFVILCIGRFSGVPNIPDFPPNKGPEAFINGIENPCTLLFRNLHWSVPADSSPFGVLAVLYLSRFSELMLHKPGEGPFLSLLVTLLSPLRWTISKLVESYIKFKIPLKRYNLIPAHRFSADVTSCSLAVTPENFYDRVEEGSILLKKSKRFSFYANGLTFDDDDATAPLETDIVILGTGYKGEVKLRKIFKSPTFQNYIAGVLNSTVTLYRGCIHPRIPQLAVIGFAESYANLYTSEMRCRWLAHFLEEGFKLPSIKEMEKDVLEWEKYMKRYSSGGACVTALHVWYNDQLCKDMGCNPKRKKGYFAELFQPYGPTDYANLTPGKKIN